MTREEINQAAYREILPGTRFDEFFDKPSHKVYNKGKGQTLEVLKSIQEMAYVYQEESAKIAEYLFDADLEKNIENIHWFLFWHIHYSIDGTYQDLKSPNWCWKTRSEGTDCKTYTLMASTILLMQNVKHFLRRIKQRGLGSSAYTHVYVVIPRDQKKGNLSKGYFVLDGTINPNKEVPFIKSHELYMEPNLPIRWLTGPINEDQYPFAMAATGTSNEIEGAYGAFNEFLNILSDKGVSEAVLNSTIAVLNSYLAAGIDPLIKILPTGIQIEKQVIAFKGSASGLSSAYPFAMAAGESSSYDLDVNLDEVWGDMQESGWWDSTFSSVFQNGFNFSCWNSSNNPNKTKEQVKVDAPHIFQLSGLRDGVTEESLAAFTYYMECYIVARHRGENNGDLAQCTRDANRLGKELMAAFRDDIRARAKAALNAVGKDMVEDGRWFENYIGFNVPSDYYNGHVFVYDVEQVRHAIVDLPGWTGPVATGPITIDEPAVNVGTPSTSTGSSTTGGSTTVGNYTGDQPVNDNYQTAGMGTATIVIGGAALAWGAWELFFKKAKK